MKQYMKPVPFALVLSACCAVPVCTALADELLVTGLSGVVRSIDLDTGVVGDRGVCAGPVSSLAVADGVLYLGSPGGEVYVFDLDANQVVRQFEVTGSAHAMAWDGQHLLVANSADTIVSVDPADGSVVETRTLPLTDISAIGVDAGGLFAGGQSSVALRSHLGQNDFDFFAACASMINAMAFSADSMFLAGTTFFGQDEGTVYRFDKFVGGVNYADTFPAPNDASAALAHNGLVYIGGSDGTVHEMDPASGAVLRSFDIGFAVSGVAPASGLVSCPADYDISGNLNFFDVTRFLAIFTARLPAGDTNGDGLHNFTDVQRFLDIYQSGCP